MLKARIPCPKAGNGVNAWVNRRIIYLRSNGVPREKVIQMVREETKGCGRNTDQDIMHSLETWETQGGGSGGNGGFELTGVNSNSGVKWLGEADHLHRSWVLEQVPKGGDVMWEGTWDAGALLLKLFDDVGKLVCVATERNRAITMTLREILETDLRGWQYIVPNPMHKIQGKNKIGDDSYRCLDNVSTRRWHQVVEFDSGTIEEQIRLHDWLSSFRTLEMLVYSGGKSVHGWYDCYIRTARENAEFMKEAVKIGADRSLWIPCQLCRFPGGTNSKSGKKQEIIWWKG